MDLFLFSSFPITVLIQQHILLIYNTKKVTLFFYLMYKHEELQNSILKSYEFKELIGEGVSSKVYRAFDNNRKCSFAIKVIPKLYLTSHPKLYELVKNQISLLKECNNNNVIKCYDVFQSSNSIFIVTELCNSLDLEKYIRERTNLAEDHAVIFLKQLLNGFKGLHSLGCMHRDLKLANILVNNESCKLADLGFAKKMNETEITYTMVGTQITMAPEVLEQKGYGFGADIWSLGVVFYQMIFGEYPYRGINRLDLMNNIKTKGIKFNNRRISAESKDFIKRCLTYDPKKRLTWQQVYDHQIISKKSLKSFHMLYSLDNPSEDFKQNREFYTKTKLEQKELKSLENEAETPQQSHLLRESNRKRLIIEEIKEIVKRKRKSGDFQCQQILINKQNIEDTDLLFSKYAQEYVHYFNKLSCVFKFVRFELIQHKVADINNFSAKNKFRAVNVGGTIKIIEEKREQATNKGLMIEQLIYLLYKRSYCELLQFSKIIQTGHNIFKIPKSWANFVASDYYKKMCSVVISSINRCSQILRTFQQSACLSLNQQISKDACQQLYEFQKIQHICAKWLKPGVKTLIEYLKNVEQRDEKLLDFMEGILYTIIGEEGKMKPEQFDVLMGELWEEKQRKADIEQRFEIYLNFL